MTELPLAGRRILVTRARHQAGALADQLRALGAEVVEIPAIAIVPPESYAPLDAALNDLSPYQWLIVTSVNGARALAERIALAGVAPSAFSHLRTAAVGSATARALREMGLEIAVTPREYVAESLVETLGDQVRGQRVLLARAAVARDVIPGALRTRGATVDIVDAYRTVVPAESVARIRTILGSAGGVPDTATFTSSSTVTNFLHLLQEAGIGVPKTMRVISIGPVTSQTLREHDWEPAAEADPHDLNGLVRAVVGALA
ncbi:MAG: uroporphyrinogen-III synthase [Acidobacteriaceae bacterium]